MLKNNNKTIYDSIYFRQSCSYINPQINDWPPLLGALSFFVPLSKQ